MQLQVSFLLLLLSAAASAYSAEVTNQLASSSLSDPASDEINAESKENLQIDLTLHISTGGSNSGPACVTTHAPTFSPTKSAGVPSSSNAQVVPGVNTNFGSTSAPTFSPTVAVVPATSAPTVTPTAAKNTSAPSVSTMGGSAAPLPLVTSSPSLTPVAAASDAPSLSPSGSPSVIKTLSPTNMHTATPSVLQATTASSDFPSSVPSKTPSYFNNAATKSEYPSVSPSIVPSAAQSGSGQNSPTISPTTSPTAATQVPTQPIVPMTPQPVYSAKTSSPSLPTGVVYSTPPPTQTAAYGSVPSGKGKSAKMPKGSKKAKKDKKPKSAPKAADKLSKKGKDGKGPPPKDGKGGKGGGKRRHLQNAQLRRSVYFP